MKIEEVEITYLGSRTLTQCSLGSPKAIETLIYTRLGISYYTHAVNDIVHTPARGRFILYRTPGTGSRVRARTLVRRYHDATPSSPGDLGSSSGVLRRMSTDMVSKPARYASETHVRGRFVRSCDPTGTGGRTDTRTPIGGGMRRNTFVSG